MSFVNFSPSDYNALLGNLNPVSEMGWVSALVFRFLMEWNGYLLNIHI